MRILILRWCVALNMIHCLMFPSIECVHLLLGFMTSIMFSIINTIVIKIAHIKGIELIQPNVKDVQRIDWELYPVYVATNSLTTIWFTSWLWVYLPISTQNISLSNTIGAFIQMMLIYDFIYYFCHRFMHSNRFVYINMHKTHHQIVNPTGFFDGLYVHPVEYLIFLWLMYLPLYIVDTHIVGILMYIISIFDVGFMYHIGLKFPSFLPVLNPKFHDDHHRRNIVNFSFFTELPDFIFQTLL